MGAVDQGGVIAARRTGLPATTTRPITRAHTSTTGSTHVSHVSPSRITASACPSSCRDDNVLWWVYFAAFIGFERFVKIGVSLTPERRVKDFGTGSPWPLRLVWMYPGAQALEACLHRRFVASHQRGEWFRFTADIRRHIEDVKALGVGCVGRPGHPQRSRAFIRVARGTTSTGIA